jgi:AcrR family transcriptional regulator
MPISQATIDQRKATLVAAAHDLIREKAGSGFSMLELARQAGVSPATPYNLLATKANILSLVVKEEFQLFRSKMACLEHNGQLSRLLSVIDLLSAHHSSDKEFYFGLFRSAGNSGDLGPALREEGRLLFGEMVRSAITEEKSKRNLRPEMITDVLLRDLRGTVEAWYVDEWSVDRFRNEVAYSTRLILLPAFDGNAEARLRRELSDLEDLLADAYDLRVAAATG